MESSEEHFENLDKEADNYYARRNYKAALKTWKKALTIQPDSSAVYRKIGNTHLRLANPLKAAEAFRDVIRLQQDAWDVKLELTKLNLASGNINSAESILKKLIIELPNEPSIYLFQGDLMLIKNKLKEAEISYHKAVTLKPDFELALIKLATCYFIQDKCEIAEKTYKILSSLKPASIEVLIQMSNYWKLNENLEKAKECLLKAVRLEPEDLSLQKILLDFYYDTRQYKEAVQTINEILKKAPDKRDVKKLLVEIMLFQNKTHEAQILLDELSKGKTLDPELYLLKGKYHLITKKHILATTQYKSFVEVKPNISLGHYMLGLAYMSGGQTHLARQSLMRALMLDPYLSEAELALADIYYKNEKFEICLEHVSRVCAREPENFRAYMIKGNVQLAQKKYDKAMANFINAGQLHPQAFAPLYFMAMTAEKSNQIKETIKLYSSLLADHPNLADAALRYARFIIKAGKIEEEKHIFEKAIQNVPKSGYLYLILGEIYLALDNTLKAKDCFKNAIALKPDLVTSYLRLAAIHKKKQELDEAKKILKACIEHIPDFPEAYIELAYIYNQEWQINKAVSTLETGIAKNPKSVYLANNLAWLYLEQDKNIDKAFTLAQIAHEYRPNDPSIADTLGWAYYKKNFFNQALWILKEAINKAPNNSLIHFHMGKVLYAMGNTSAAISSLKKAISLNLEQPYEKEAKTLQQQLQKLIEKTDDLEDAPDSLLISPYLQISDFALTEMPKRKD
ncbi:MAG: tetratricopeptide repeat protein [Deltaproteobacteria bacterium]|nr:tetratricopeptide repeat protein [Deltaproteobacteria bacterium]